MEFDDLKCFLSIYKNLSITKAASDLNLSKTAVSKKLESLEWKLGFKLFVRNTRQITPTDEAKNILPEIENIINRVQNLSGKIEKKKTLRITAPHSMVNSFLGELLFNYLKENPEIKIDIVSTDTLLDLLDKRIDLSIRINPKIDSNLIGKKVGTYSLMAVVRKEFKKSLPKSIEDLVNFETLYIDKHQDFFSNLSKKEFEKMNSKRTLLTKDSNLIHSIIKNHDVVGIRSNWDLSDFKVVLPNFKKECGDIWLLRNPYNDYSSELKNLFQFLEKNIPTYLV